MTQYLINIKWTYELLANGYRVADIIKLHLIVKGIIMPSLKSIGQL